MAYKRKTRNVYIVEGLYCGTRECLTSSDSRQDALDDLRAYNENEIYTPHRMRTKREYITGGEI